jgi:hypothetical protein
MLVMNDPSHGVAGPLDVDGETRRRLQDLAERQDQVCRREQLLTAGITDRQIDRGLDAHRWQVVSAGLIVLHNTRLTPGQRQGIAVLAGGRLCALAARTAAAAAGLTRWEPPALEVVVPRGTTYPDLPFPVRVHESRRFSSGDVVESWPPRVSIDRALIDAGSWVTRPRSACGLLATGVQQGLTTATRLLAELDRAGQIRHRRLMARALVDIDGGAQAVSEMDFLRFCLRHGFPRPELQVVRLDERGRRRYLDATLKTPDGRLVRVEIDGALHLVVQTYWNDMWRSNDLAIGREVALRFPSYVIHANDPDAAAQLRRALNVSGPSAQPAAQAS